MQFSKIEKVVENLKINVLKVSILCNKVTELNIPLFTKPKL